MIETSGALEIENIVSADAILEDKKKYPLGTYGKPEDVALACVYLLSDASKWVTGVKLIVDGGFTAQ
jgi:NAD(P)-dependent dehydrogenase (short-subunit alcohol dehydrogenase family)